MASARLTRTVGAGNRRTWTWSGWVKRTKLSYGDAYLMGVYVHGADHFRFYFPSTDQLHVKFYNNTSYELLTNRRFRDTNAWYHIVLRVDNTQSTASNRFRLYINGEQETSFATENQPTQNLNMSVNDSNVMEIGSYNNGLNDKNSKAGNDLIITIDSELQEYGEQLMSNKKGAIVAIEPSTGEILSLVSAPSYNPNLLVGRERSKNYFELYKDSIYKPLIDKGLLSTFPAGSPFKVIVGLIALQENVINDKNTIFCGGEYIYGRNKKSMKCHCGGGYRNIYNAISESCNSYFADAYRKTISINNNISENFDMWSEGVKSFGLGNYLNNDLPIGKKGMIPNSEFYDRWYPDFRWGPTTNLSNSIGQGEILVTPIQLANMIAAVANKGFYYTPHIIKQIQGDSIPLRFRQKNIIEIEKQYFDIIEVGLSKVYKSGTGKLLNIPGIEICGKSGTAENFTKINGKKTQLTDHSIFVAYAPKNDPQIAIAVLVENGYYGSTWAGRISSLMIEKYLKGAISNKGIEKLVVNKSLDEEYKKPFSDKPFKINKL